MCQVGTHGSFMLAFNPIAITLIGMNGRSHQELALA